MSLYLILLLSSLIGPLALSFDKKVHFYKSWKYVIPAILIVAFFFIVFDIYFTSRGIWEFNDKYSSMFILNLPIEEWLFFIVVPYASLFIHYCIFAYYPHLHVKASTGKLITYILMLLSIIAAIVYYDRFYTLFISCNLFIILLLSFLDKSRVIDKFYSSFIVIAIPFVLFDGVLTGTGIEDQVVYYPEAYISGYRINTIPSEDIVYCFCMLLSSLLLISLFTARKKTIETQ